MMSSEPRMDWDQVRLNGGPPCFAVLDGEENWYCGRAERWAGHDGDHVFISLKQMIAARVSESTPSDEVAQRAEKFEVALRQIAAGGKSYDWQSLAIKRRDIARTALGLDGVTATDVEQGREEGEGDG